MWAHVKKKTWRWKTLTHFIATEKLFRWNSLRPWRFDEQMLCFNVCPMRKVLTRSEKLAPYGWISLKIWKLILYRHRFKWYTIWSFYILAIILWSHQYVHSSEKIYICSQPVQFERIQNYLQFGSHVACLNDRTWKILNVHKRNQCKNWPILNVTLTPCYVRSTWKRWDWKFLRTCWTKDIIITFRDPKR